MGPRARQGSAKVQADVQAAFGSCDPIDPVALGVLAVGEDAVWSGEPL